MLDSSRIPKPRPRPGLKPGPKRIAPGAPPRSARATILLVEDERSLREFLERTLTQAGYRVLAAGDGESALSLSEEFDGEIHLLVTDVMMPLMNGKDLADRLCALRPEIKVLFVSGFSRADFWPDACEDMTDWLPKPFTAAQFHGKVRHLLDSINEK